MFASLRCSAYWVSGPDEASDGLGGLAHLLLGLGAPGSGRVDDTVGQVLIEQPQSHRLQRLRHRRDLGEDVDAVLLVLDHPLQAAGLPLDAAQPLEVVVLALGRDVAVLMGGPRSLSPAFAIVRCRLRHGRLPLALRRCADRAVFAPILYPPIVFRNDHRFGRRSARSSWRGAGILPRDASQSPGSCSSSEESGPEQALDLLDLGLL